MAGKEPFRFIRKWITTEPHWLTGEPETRAHCEYEASFWEGPATADRLAYVRYLEDGWRQGGYYPMTREEFEASHPEAALENNQDDSSGTRGQ